MKFTPVGAWIDRPITIACGRCSGCRLEKTRQWAMRAMHETQLHERSCFVTLTYDEQHVPEHQSLVLEHWQNFAKRLRKNKGKFRFLMCGEYGEKNKRPHYHALIWGMDFHEDREQTEEKPNKLYKSEELTKIWGMGRENPIGSISFDSASYVARYTTKKINGEKQGAHYGELVNTETGEVTLKRKPEFSTQSRNPGLGAKWIEKYESDVYPRDYVVLRGMKMRPPKAYDVLMEKKNPEMMRMLKIKRMERAKENSEDNTRERLEVRERIQRRREKRKEKTKV